MLTEYNFRSLYSTGEKNSPVEFFTNALSRSDHFDLGLGFFSSASINVLCLGFARFISNGGRMRLYINQFLSENDYKALVTTPHAIEDSVIKDFHAMLNLLSKRDEHFFNCLSFLISTGRIDIRIVIPKAGGIAHQKFGVFTDENGNKVSFIGSLNLTASALTSRNIESISCLVSWKGAEDSISEYEDLFNSIFTGEKENIIVLKADQLTQEIIKAFPSPDEKTIIDEEDKLIKEWHEQSSAKQTIESVVAKENDEPHFPFPTGAFPYQIEAYQSWRNNGYTGIFAMATGTGKTITSLNCVLEEYKNSGKYRMLILVPSNDLVSQWVGEVGKFNFQNVYVVNGMNDWRKSLTELKNEVGWGIERNYVIISTYVSFTDPSFQNLIKKLNDSVFVAFFGVRHKVSTSFIVTNINQH